MTEENLVVIEETLEDQIVVVSAAAAAEKMEERKAEREKRRAEIEKRIAAHRAQIQKRGQEHLDKAPDEKKADNNENRDAHVVALVRKPNILTEDNGQKKQYGYRYLGISNSMIRNLSLWSTDYNASWSALTLAFEVYGPPLKEYKVYYLPAKSGGAYDLRLLDPVANGLTAFETRP